ncbi:early nodulin-like protein 19 [Miscanthus floridulus]|uniref:early nodulin-like protein 19 n=1 Tax=Miscanthus floridulus TaxID=154761 RepID=UPI0034584C80
MNKAAAWLDCPPNSDQHSELAASSSGRATSLPPIRPNSPSPNQPTKASKIRGMAMRLALAMLLVAAAASQLPSAAVAANYTVGDEKGWNPDVDYTAWVKKHKPFYKGDWLIFEYQNGRSDVVQVDEVGYDNCDKANALSSYSKGHTYAFQLKEAKDYYFICSYGYCYNGMKVHVTAKSSGSSSSGDDSSSSDDSSSGDSPSPPAKKSKAKSSDAPPPSLLAATPIATAAAAALLLNRML